jgi:hypothetical protein
MWLLLFCTVTGSFMDVITERGGCEQDIRDVNEEDQSFQFLACCTFHMELKTPL